MANKKLLVLVKPSERESINEIAKGLADAGMTIEHILRATGVITGYAENGLMGKLNTVNGVQSLRQDGVMESMHGNDQMPTRRARNVSAKDSKISSAAGKLRDPKL